MTTQDNQVQKMTFELNKDLFSYWKNLPSMEDKKSFICGDWVRHMPVHTSVKENWLKIAELFVSLVMLKDPEFLTIIKEMSGFTKIKKSIVLKHIEAPKNNLLYVLLNAGFARSSLDLNDKLQKTIYELVLSLVQTQMSINKIALDYSWITKGTESWDRELIADILYECRDVKMVWQFFAPMLGEVSKYVTKQAWSASVGSIKQDGFDVNMNFAHFWIYNNFHTHQNVISMVSQEDLKEPVLFNGNPGNIMDLLLLTEDDKLSRGGHLFVACPETIKEKMIDIFGELRNVLADVPRTKFGVKSLVGVLSLNINVEVCKPQLNKYIEFFDKDLFKEAVQECRRKIHPAIKEWLDNN